MFDVRHYLARDGKDPVDDWLRRLRDVQAKAAIIRRLNRLETGNFGDFKPLREGVHELRIDVGPGYRVYYARLGKSVVLLVCGGIKRTHDADVDRACERCVTGGAEPIEGAMRMKDRSHDDAMAELFRTDPATAATTLDAILADGDQGELLVTLRQMAQAFGGVSAIAKAAELKPTQLYRTLSEQGNPELRSLSAILRTMGLRLAVQPLAEPVPHV